MAPSLVSGVHAEMKVCRDGEGGGRSYLPVKSSGNGQAFQEQMVS